MIEENILITDKDLETFQNETDNVLREYCLINIENYKNQVLILSKQIEKMDKTDPAIKISTEQLVKSQKELALYIDELKYLS